MSDKLSDKDLGRELERIRVVVATTAMLINPK